jgi:hypothetical protein
MTCLIFGVPPVKSPSTHLQLLRPASANLGEAVQGFRDRSQAFPAMALTGSRGFAEPEKGLASALLRPRAVNSVFAKGERLV